jgi:hypothetical protein
VDLAKKRRGRCSGKRPSYYMVEWTVVFSECTLPLFTNFHRRGFFYAGTHSSKDPILPCGSCANLATAVSTCALKKTRTG